MPANDDLLVKLYRWAHRQNENFTTEAFVHVLEQLVESAPQRALRFLTWLTDARAELTDADMPRLEVHTQFRTDEHGIPDVRILGPQLDVIVEVKLDEKLSRAQTDGYRAELGKAGAARRVLVGLTGKEPFDELGDDVVLRLWRDVGDELDKLKDDESPLMARDIDQFLALLGHLRLLRAPKVESPIAHAIEAHREWASEDPERPSLFNSRVRSFAALDAWQGLAPLRALLQQLREVLLERGHDSVRLESGQSGAFPWIGFSIDFLEYFIELNLDNPQSLTFTRYRDEVDANSFDGTLGRTYRSQGKTRWSNDLDLRAHSYFGLDAKSQVALLRDFAGTSVDYARRL